MDYIYILGIKLHKIKKKDILKKVREWLAGDKFHYITTVNPEFLLEAKKDAEFSKILNDADLSIPDGIGLKFAAWMFGRNIYRVAGSDLAKEILAMEGRKYFFIWKNGLSGVDDVKEHTPNPSQEGKYIDGQAIERDGSDIDWKKFNDFSPDILFVGLGAPYQEKLIAKIKLRENQSSDAFGKIPPSASWRTPLQKGGIRVAIGVGGTFDFLTGKTERAPKIMRMLGLEWLYRMCQPPKSPHNYFYRVKRVLNAVLVFPLEVIKWRIKMIFCYRKGMLAVIINKDNKILLCERSDEKDHWQFPQGGLEKNEIMEECLLREIDEETGLKEIKNMKKFDKKYKYKCDDPRHIKNLIKAKYGFKGQIKDVFIVKFLGSNNEVKLDNREFINYKWVAVDELLEKLHPVRKEVGEVVVRELENLLEIKNYDSPPQSLPKDCGEV